MNENLRKAITGKKTGLVLSGGVVRAAAWHIGVCLALEELGYYLDNYKAGTRDQEHPLKISSYVGSSAGAMMATIFAAGYGPREMMNAMLGAKGSTMKPITYKDMFYVKRAKLKARRPEYFDPFKRFPILLRTLLKPILGFSGFFSTTGLKNYLLNNILETDDFNEFGPELFIVATQLDHSRKVIFSKYNYPNPSHDNTAVYYTNTSISDAVAASMSVPPFYTPYPIFNDQTKKVDYYIDGEIRDTLSKHVAEDNNCNVIISSWTHTPYHYQTEIGSLTHYGLPSIAIQSIFLMIQKKIISANARRMAAEDIIETINQYCKEQKLDESHRKNLIHIIEKKLHYKRHITHIDIFPDHEDYKIFFSDTFSLNMKNLSYVVEQAYRKTLSVFENEDYNSSTK